MHGVRRVAIFCVMTTLLPTLLIITPLYLRHSVFTDVVIPVAESDVIAVVDGISSIFCQSHTLLMNSSFNAFQLNGVPELSSKRKHIRLKKSMTLPDDTLEYWGFYLLHGATVKLKVCSRYEGARLLVVRGERNLRTCGLMQHNLKNFGATMDQEHNRVKVTFENAAEEIVSSDDGLVNNDPNTAAEDTSDVQETNVFIRDRLSRRKQRLQQKVHRNKNNSTEHRNNSRLEVMNTQNSSINTNSTGHHKRHARHKFSENQERLYKLHQTLKPNEEINMKINRVKRDGQMLDGGIEHGGNAGNYTVESDESSVSSFEMNLFTCYDGQIVLTQEFNAISNCVNVSYLEKTEKTRHLEAVHAVGTDSYYYYIFYSDNDYISNDIHAIFDIYKPTYRYTNSSKKKECLNTTKCEFPIQFASKETVIVEVPTRDGIEHEDDDITYLVSTCQPRMSVYIIFPVAVIFLILGCSFL